MQSRINYLLGDISSTPPPVVQISADMLSPRAQAQCIVISGVRTPSRNHYFRELDRYLSDTEDGTQPFAALTHVGDVWYPTSPCTLVKTRPLNTTSAVLLPLNVHRHWGPIDTVLKHDIPHENKLDKLVWRGATTGKGELHRSSRVRLMELYSRHPTIDVGLSFYCQEVTGPAEWVKPQMSIAEQLRYKYLLAIEGNDVATNLKWCLASNSTVLMPPPAVESWAMEGKLEAWTHYVPVRTDLSDLETQLEWCRNNPRECRDIAMNGKLWIQTHGLDNSAIRGVLQRYRDIVRFKVSRSVWGNRPICSNVQIIDE